MPGASLSPKYGYPLSREELRKTMGGKSALYEFLNHYALKSTVFFKDDFTGKALNTTNDWTVDAGATATTWALTAGPGGFVRGVTGTTAATSGLQLIYPLLQLSGDKNAGVLFRWRTSDITELRFECGLVNALPSVNTPVVNSMATPTFNTTAQAAVWLYNHTGTTTTMGLYGIGSDKAANKTASTTGAPVNDTWQYVRIQTLTDKAFVFINDAQKAVAGVTIQGGDALYLAVSVKNNSTTSQNVDLDLVAAWADR